MPASWAPDMAGEHQLGAYFSSQQPLTRTYPAEEGLDDWGKSVQEQDAAVEELRQSLLKRGSWNPNGTLDFYSLLRFIRARDYHLDRALNMVLDHLQWRQELDVDSILDDFEFSEKEQFLSVYPQGYHGTDKQGHPIYIQHLGSVDLARIRQVTSEERMTKFHIQEYERCLEYIFPIISKIHGKQIDKTFAIVDAKGIGLRHLTRDVREVLGKMMSIDQNNYPETLYHTCVINAPAAFRVIWNVVKPMLNARTQAKVEVCPRDYLPSLKQWIDEENIPKYLGGKSKGTLVDDVGPWSKESLVAEVDAVRKSKKARTEHIVKKESADLVPRQSSTLSIETEYEDALASFQLEESSGFHKTFDPPPAAANISSELSTLPPIPSKSVSLSSRISTLEEKLGQQKQRLQHFVPQKYARTSTTGTCNLVDRVQILEEGMDLLLRAQEEQLAKDRQPLEPESRACSCCCIM